MEPQENANECRYCKGTGRIEVRCFDFSQYEPCPFCTGLNVYEHARAALAREFGTDAQRRQKREPMRAPRG